MASVATISSLTAMFRRLYDSPRDPYAFRYIAPPDIIGLVRLAVSSVWLVDEVKHASGLPDTTTPPEPFSFTFGRRWLRDYQWQHGVYDIVETELQAGRATSYLQVQSGSR